MAYRIARYCAPVRLRYYLGYPPASTLHSARWWRALRKGANEKLKTMIDEAKAAGSVSLFSVRHEFRTEWAKFIRADNIEAIMTLEIGEERFPYWSNGSPKTVKSVDIFARDDQNSHPNGSYW